MGRDGKIRLVILAVCIVSGLLLGLWLPRAAQFLVVEDRFDHAELALVLSGRPKTRALAARDLYRQGRVDAILVIPEPPDPSDQELIELGLFNPATPPLAEQILIASGVPRDKITFLPEPADGTIAEARKVLAFVKGSTPHSIVLVTSQYAARRTRFIFRQVFQREAVRILSFPTSYETFEVVRWWSQPRNALYVVTEYQKLLLNTLTLALRPHTP